MCEEPLLQLTTVTIMHRQQNSGIQSALALLAVELFSHALGIPKIPSQKSPFGLARNTVLFFLGYVKSV